MSDIKSHDVFIEEILNIHPTIDVIDTYYNNATKYCVQKEFDDLLGIGGRRLSFDFCLYEKNMLIEYQGEFHDGTAWQQSEENYQKQQKNDAIKKAYVREKEIDLLEIWYWDYEKINSILFDAVFGGELDDEDE